MGNKKKRILAAILSAAMLVTMQPVVYAEEETTENAGTETTDVSQENDGEEEEVSTITNIMSTGDRENTYSSYYEKHSDKTAPKKEIVIDAATGEIGADIAGEVPVYTIEEYEISPTCIASSEAESLLRASARRYVTDSMVASSIKRESVQVLQKKTVYMLTGSYICTEMIGRVKQEQIGDIYGKSN